MTIRLSNNLIHTEIINGNTIVDKKLNIDYDGKILSLKGNINDKKIFINLNNKDLINILSVKKNNNSFETMLTNLSKRSK
jgi:hypothetical protein